MAPDRVTSGSEIAVGVDAGGTNIKAVAIDEAGAELARCTLPTPEGREELVAAVARAIADLQRAADGIALHVGLAAPGLAARDGRSIVWMRGRMEAVQGLDWTEALGGESQVRVLNDAHAAIVGEAWLGAAKGCANVVLLTLGTGIGGGVMVDGNLLQGRLGRAGHLGHISLDIDGPPDICRCRCGPTSRALWSWPRPLQRPSSHPASHDLVP